MYQARVAAMDRSDDTIRLLGELRARADETAKAALVVLLHCDQFAGRLPTDVVSKPSKSQEPVGTMRLSSASMTRRTLRRTRFPAKVCLPGVGID
jgi:hypothetical protein